MEEIKRTKQVAAVSEETKAAIIRNSVQGLGNQPVMSAAEMKKQFVKPVVNGDGKPSAVGEIDRIARETNEAIDEALGIAEKIVEVTEEKFSQYKESVDGIIKGVENTGRENAAKIKALDEQKQSKTDSTLQTNNKTVPGAINEVHDKVEGHSTHLTDLENSTKELRSQTSALAAKDTILQDEVAAFKESSNESVRQLAVQSAANAEKLAEVEAIAKGASVPLDFDNYQQMIEAFNQATPKAYLKGNDVHVVTPNVPDVWISKIVDTYKQYDYVSDADFEEDLKENERVQVGYYLLSPLEGQKVDMGAYAKKEEHRADIEALLSLFPTVQR